MLYDKDGYAFIARDEKTIKNLEQLDTSNLPHEYELGCLLGYPDCCCKQIANIGEKNIDKYEMNLVNNSNFKGVFELINPQGYKDGYALISHIPCSSTRKDSLLIAQKSLHIIAYYYNKKCFEPWIQHWKQYILKKY